MTEEQVEGIRNLELLEENLVPLDSVGPAKARAIIAEVSTIGELADVDPVALSTAVKGLSVAVARSAVDWAKDKLGILVSELPIEDESLVEQEIDPTSPAEVEDILQEEDTHEGEEERDSGSDTFDGLKITLPEPVDSLKTPAVPSKTTRVVEIKSR